jgi:hypothetical protein
VLQGFAKYAFKGGEVPVFLKDLGASVAPIEDMIYITANGNA